VAVFGEQSSALIGRDSELAELERSLDHLDAGRPWFVQILGEPGIGKTRLLTELARRASARGHLVLTGRAAEFEQDLPFAVLRDAFDEYLGSLDSRTLSLLQPETWAELSAVFPSLTARVDSSANRPSAGDDRYRTHHAIRALLAGLTARQPTVVVLDDVHWADAASMEVIAVLLHRFRGRLLAVLAARYRPARLAAVLDTATREGLGSRIELSPLSAAEADALIDARLDAQERASLYRQTGGNPFYLEQLARAAAPGPGWVRLAAESPFDDWRPPAAVTASIRQELSQLSAETRVIVDAAAIAGESFEPQLVAAIAQRPDPAALTALDELFAMDVIRFSDTPQRFRFRHPILRRVIYDELRPGWRLGAHGRAAAALTVAEAPTPEAALHIERSAVAGDERAVAMLIDAARAVAPRAPLTAGRWLRTVLRLLPSDADPRMRIELLCEAAAALASAGADEESVAELEQAFALLPSAAQSARAELLARIAEARRRSGQPFESRSRLLAVLHALDASERTAVQAVRLELAIDHYWHREFDQVGPMLGSTLADAREHDETSIVALAAALQSLAGSAAQHTDEALRDLAHAEAVLHQLSDVQLASRVYLGVYIGLAALRLEHLDDALTHVHRCLRIARLTGQDAMAHPWLSITARVLLLKGEIDKARRDATAAVDTTLLPGENWRTVWALEADAMAAFCAGDAQRALASATDMLTRSERGPDPFFTPAARVQLAGAFYLSGDPAAAARELEAFDAESGWDLLDLHAGHGWDLLVRATLATGRLDAAESTATRAQLRADASELPLRRATAALAFGTVRLARGATPAALQSARDAAKIADQVENPLVAGRASLLTGRALAADGQRDAAVTALRTADSLLSGCSASKEAEATRRELRRLGQRTPHRDTARHSGSGLAGLSTREREVAGLVASGKTNKDIANALYLSEKTIESHLARIYNKLDVRSRAALTALIVRQESQ
jgi:ATP/maltotriose-dependent transcriptional regulator MalT